MNKKKLIDFFHKLCAQFRLFAMECLPVAVVINLVIEGFSRKSFFQPIFYLITSPLVFLFNTLLIATTLSLSFLFRKRKFARFVISALWLTVGVADFVMLQFRTTPFTAVDLLLLDSAFSIMTHYLTVFQIVLIFIAIAAAIAIAVFLFFKAKKATKGTSVLLSSTLCALLILSTLLSCKAFTACGILESTFGNLAQGFHDNGLPYCFFSSIFGTGISKPGTYSEEEIDRILASITETPADEPVFKESPTSTPVPTVTKAPYHSFTPTPMPTPVPTAIPYKETEHPNFVFIQLESFFDPTYITEATYSKDPVPNFRRLKETGTSGFLTVPSIGAGTANTEFEILSGISLGFFGPGEYPYKTILKKTPCESIAYNLSALGLKTHAIHNNDGTFYGRNEVFSQLGFDTFTSIEYMDSFEITPLGWAKDNVLIKEIMDTLKSTKEQDFVYTISVQGHGSYPEEPILENPAILVNSLPEELSDYYYGIRYFVNQLYEMDLFLGDLMDALAQYDEEVVLVLFGDHLPSFPFTEELLENGSLFETEYVMWHNYNGTNFEDKNLHAYALSANVLNNYGIHEGLFTRFHQTQNDSSTYLEDFEMLAYDVLYGDIESYGGVLPFVPTDLQFGVRDIKLTNVVIRNNSKESSFMYLHGTNFTPYSTAFINGEECDTTYISANLISASGFEPSETFTVSVAQVGEDSHPLSFTNEFSCKAAIHSMKYE